MPLFKRKEEAAAPKPQPKPHVYVWHDQDIAFTTSRFFFTETLVEGETKWLPNPEGGVTLSTPGFLPEVRALQERIISAVPGLATMVGNHPRFYRHYLAVTWYHDDQPYEFLAEMNEPIEQAVVTLLAEHFGWEQPNVEHFLTSNQMHAKARELGVDWRLGRHP